MVPFEPDAASPGGLNHHATYMRYWRGIKNKKRAGEDLWLRHKAGNANLFDNFASLTSGTPNFATLSKF